MQEEEGKKTKGQGESSDTDYGEFYDIFEGEEVYQHSTYVFDGITLTLDAYGYTIFFVILSRIANFSLD